MNSIKRYLQFVKPYRLQIIVTILNRDYQICHSFIIPLLIKYVLDDIIANDALSKADKIDQLVWIIAIMLVIFVVLRPPVEYYRQYFAQWTSSKILYDIRDQLYTHIQKLSFKYYSNTKTGEVISRVINDVEQTKTFVSHRVDECLA